MTSAVGEVGVATVGEAGSSRSAGATSSIERSRADTSSTTPSVAPSPVPDEELASCPAVSTTLDLDGREVLVRVPAATNPLPIVIAIHGYRGTPQGLEFYSELSGADLAVEAIVVYPSGTPLDLGYGWNSGAQRYATSAGDDVAALGAVLDMAVQLPCADPEHVWFLGESNGAGMALRAVCDPRLAGQIERLVMVNAAIDDGVLATCAEVVPSVPLLAVAARLDRIVGYEGEHPPFLAVESWFASLATRVAGCPTGPLVESTSAPGSTVPEVTMMEVAGCGPCGLLIVANDGAHTWPGAREGVAGRQPGSFELSEMLASSLSSGSGNNGCE